jgi:uncharacterized protein (TIGR03435 family)
MRAIAACLFGSFGCLAQPPASPAFDVASIRSAATCDSPQEVQTSPGSLTIRGRTLRVLIQWAYDAPQFQVSGPDWLRDNCFDLAAKSAGAPDESQMRLMLRTLLADRFGVKVHSEQKEMQVYAMVLTPEGPKFHESTTVGPPVIDRGNPLIVAAHRVTLSDVGDRISAQLERPVIDTTGLKGRYEIRLDLSP